MSNLARLIEDERLVIKLQQRRIAGLEAEVKTVRETKRAALKAWNVEMDELADTKRELAEQRARADSNYASVELIRGKLSNVSKELSEERARIEELEAAWLECEGIAANGLLQPTVNGVLRVMHDRDNARKQLAEERARLDWLEQSGIGVKCDFGIFYSTRYPQQINKRHKSLRVAIDDACREEGTG